MKLTTSFLVLLIEVATGVVVWPEPVSMEVTGKRMQVGGLRFEKGFFGPVIEAAVKRYTQLIFAHGENIGKTAVKIEVENTKAELSLDMDESYTLVVSTTIKIKAKTQWGILRALETLSQLFAYEDEVYWVYESKISDSPRFAHRGLLIDSGRHFLPLVAIEGMLDAMSYTKLNVLHWHLTEDQSFPMPSRQFPELPDQGAFSKRERYSRRDIKSIVSYAYLRGIRIIPEFDMPGHTSSWRNAHPEIFASACLDPDSRGAFDPAKNATFDLLKKVLLDDWFLLFPDAYVHLGSDEVPTTCWNNSLDLAFMETEGYTSFNDLFAYFVNSMVDLALEEKNNKQGVILWDEAYTSGSPDPNKTIIQIWHDDATQPVLDAGFKVIFSPTSAWYLDHLNTNWTDRYSLQVPDAVLGGEACAWGETMDPSDIEATVWPSLAAVAERLWSPSYLTSNITSAESRLRQFRCTLLDRGVRAEPVGLAGRTAPTGPGSCLDS